MDRFTIVSDDKELINEIWSLQTDGITFEGLLAKGGDWPSEITAYIELGASIIAFAAVLFEHVKSRKKHNPRNTKVIIYTCKNNVDLVKLTSIYEETIHIEIHEEDRD